MIQYFREDKTVKMVNITSLQYILSKGLVAIATLFSYGLFQYIDLYNHIHTINSSILLRWDLSPFSSLACSLKREVIMYICKHFIRRCLINVKLRVCVTSQNSRMYSSIHKKEPQNLRGITGLIKKQEGCTPRGLQV